LLEELGIEPSMISATYPCLSKTSGSLGLCFLPHLILYHINRKRIYDDILCCLLSLTALVALRSCFCLFVSLMYNIVSS